MIPTGAEQVGAMTVGMTAMAAIALVANDPGRRRSGGLSAVWD